MSDPTRRFRARTISAGTLAVLTAATKGDPPAGHQREWDELIGAGIAASPGVLRPRWQEVLAETAGAAITMTLVSRSGRAGMRSTISLTPTIGLGLTERRRLTVTDSEVAVDAVEDAVEMALFDPRAVWPAIQRLLPPSDTVRAEGGSKPLEERTVGVLREVPERSALPPEVLDELAAADVEVDLALTVDNGTDVPFATVRHWSAPGDGRLHEVRLRDGVAEVVEVPVGTVADEVAWLAVGAFDLRARAMGDAS